MKKITIKTTKLREVVNITPQISELLKKHPAKDGMIHLFLKHSTAALTTAYLAENLDLDMIGAFEIMLPHTLTEAEGHHTHRMGHLPAHVAASLLGPHLAVPVEGSKLQLGKFQSVVLVELNGPREREIVIDYNGRP
ncbi:MAG: secondary thiamine-phosphate synthase enzyme YjbQ [Patescibacteria group bacterium]|nr:secondary thiamine-phosphate synthase enzyme YjbQ [Patescibacteria group bacterium]